jgi:hypothetical protein
MKAGLGATMPPAPHATWSWRGQTNIRSFEMEREREHLHNLLMHSNSAVGECAE